MKTGAMSDCDPAITALIEAARMDFARGLEAKAAAIAALVGDGIWDEARRAAHKLRGSAGVHGFASVGDAAGALEDLIVTAGAPRDVAVHAKIEAKLAELRSEAERVSRGSP